MTQIRGEGDPVFTPADTETENSAASSTVESTEPSTQSDGGSETRTDKEGSKEMGLGFGDHPRWKEREDNWTKRFNQQEVRHQEDLKSIREEFSSQHKANAEESQIPSWFGGDKEQWDAYRKDRESEISKAEEKAYSRIKQEREQESKVKEKEEAAVAEATEYIKSEVAAIETDKTLNPNGDKVDANKLLKFVLDNDLVDSKGRWNYRAGYQLMRAQSGDKSLPNQQRKSVVAATTSESKAESAIENFKTSADFKKSRPW